VTTFLDWRTEPETDVAEDVLLFVRPAAMCQDRKAKYRIECFVEGCGWEEFLDYETHSDDEANDIRHEHIRWHEEGCPQ
jgi:hypothetical protein